MDWQLKEEIIQLLKDSVTLETERKYGSFGESDYFIIKLKIADEVVSERYLNIEGRGL